MHDQQYCEGSTEVVEEMLPGRGAERQKRRCVWHVDGGNLGKMV